MSLRNRKRKTKREEFFEAMDAVIPWDELVALIEPHYCAGKRGRPTRGIEPMLRMYLLQVWFKLSDEGVEDAIYDSYAFKRFMGVDFMESEQVPDATTLCNFRKLMHESGIAERLIESMKQFLEAHGKLMHGGTIVDATLIDAPSSTKNALGKRYPEMHQVKKVNQWYFGVRLHIGVDAGTGYIHSVEVTAANASERDVVPRLIRMTTASSTATPRTPAWRTAPRIRRDAHLSQVEFRTNTQNRFHRKFLTTGFDWDRYIEYQRSRVRCKVEYAFLVIKRLFGYRKVRYRGLAKNRTHAFMLCFCTNAFLLAQSGEAKAC